jgi:hypothetical protein
VGRRDKLDLIALGYPDAASETIEVISEIPERGIVRKTKADGLRTSLYRLLTVILSVKVRYATVERSE